MARFTHPLEARQDPVNPRIWTTLGNVEFWTGENEFEGDMITVFSGFRTDFASIPRFAWPIVGSPSEAGRPAVIHDWLYATHIVSRQQADEVFLKALKVCGFGYARRYAMYWSLRVAGFVAWGSSTQESRRDNRKWGMYVVFTKNEKVLLQRLAAGAKIKKP